MYSLRAVKTPHCPNCRCQGRDEMLNYRKDNKTLCILNLFLLGSWCCLTEMLLSLEIFKCLEDLWLVINKYWLHEGTSWRRLILSPKELVTRAVVPN